MSKFVTERRVIASKILDIIQPEHTEEDLDVAVKTWWQNIRSTGGLGLTYIGDQAFQQAELEFIDEDCGWAGMLSNMAFAAALDQKMLCPYYLYFNNKRKRVRVYDSRISMMIVLHGSFMGYFKTLEKHSL